MPSPSISGLLSETENTIPPVDEDTSNRNSNTTTPLADATTPDSNSITLPDGTRITRPLFPPNHHLYGRVPKHLLLPDGTPNYLPLLLTSSVYSILPPSGTPLSHAHSLSARLGNRIHFKREDQTPVFSFKLRGAYNLMKQLSEEERWRGVVACSAGNHAQGVALSGQSLSIACTIVMPLNTPSIKYLNVARLGAKVVLHGADFDEAKRECTRLAEKHGLTIVPPFDDPFVIAGQGTCAVELVRQVADVKDLDAVFVPVGGGGLLAGMLAYLKQVCPPSVKVIGVETHDADCLTQTLIKGQRITLSQVGLFADGTAVRQMGEESLRLCAQYVDEIVCVSNDELCAAIKDVFEDTRSVPEPSGALSVAGMKKYITTHRLLGAQRTFVAVVSGANINFSRLRYIAERAELGEGKEATLRVIIPETPGSFLALHSIIHPRAVTEFVYRYSSPQRAFIFLSFYLSSPSPTPTPTTNLPTNGTSTPILSPHQQRQDELAAILAEMRKKKMQPLDLSTNELAKSHARYLVGGRSTVRNERVFRFEFPERPGALRKFLEQMRFNISLFHYRNQGGDVGKILAGIQVPPAETPAFEQWLQGLQYPFVEETDNQVYRDFLDDVELDLDLGTEGEAEGEEGKGEE